MRKRCLVAALAINLLLVDPAWAEVTLEGYLVAQAPCPAFRSFRNRTNPGNIKLRPGGTYEIVAANRADTTHYLVLVPGVEPTRRWVAVDCGTPTITADDAAASDSDGHLGLTTQYIFAASWEPGFCETNNDKLECSTQTADRFDASYFSLHGLWPQRIYCDVPAEQEIADRAGDWQDLPEVVLNPALRAELSVVMPGTRSFLERHEWTKHGTCYEGDAEEYYADSLAVMAALNTSSVRELFAANLGRELTQEAIRAAFDEAFGAGAGKRVRVACVHDGGRRIITELTIGLTGTIEAAGTVGALIRAAAPTRGGCDMGIVDEAGLK